MNETNTPASEWILPDNASILPSIYGFEQFDDLFDIKDHYITYIITRDQKAIQLQLAKNTLSSRVMISSIEKSIDEYDLSIDFIVISDLRIDFEDFDIESLNTGSGTCAGNKEFLVHENLIEELLCRLIEGESSFVAIEHQDTGCIMVLKSKYISIGDKVLQHHRFDPILSCFEDLVPDQVAIHYYEEFHISSPTFCYAIPGIGHTFEITKTFPSRGSNESSVS